MCHFLQYGPNSLSSLWISLRLPRPLVLITFPAIFFENWMLVLGLTFNLTMSREFLPGSCKFSQVAPVYKAGSSGDQLNYLPISVLPFVAHLCQKLADGYSYLKN